MIFGIGNNREAIKFEQITVPLFNPTQTNLTTTQIGQYYFPEFPQLNNKKIVGINVLGGAANFNNAKIISNTNYYQIVNGNYTLNAALASLQLMTVTFFNDKNEKIIDQFPAAQLLGGPWDNTATFKLNKVFPTDIKINIKQSFVSVLDPTSSALLEAVTFNFYYRD